MSDDLCIDGELAAFLDAGPSVLAGSRDARLMPRCQRCIAVRVGPDGRELTVWLAAATADGMLADLRDNGRIAVCVCRVHDHRAVQVKGRVLAIEAADEADREWVERYWLGMVEALHEIGVPPRLTLRMSRWPAWRVRMRPQTLFVQTPGPGAGDPLERTAGGAS